MFLNMEKKTHQLYASALLLEVANSLVNQSFFFFSLFCLILLALPKRLLMESLNIMKSDCSCGRICKYKRGPLSERFIFSLFIIFIFIELYLCTPTHTNREREKGKQIQKLWFAVHHAGKNVIRAQH